MIINRGRHQWLRATCGLQNFSFGQRFKIGLLWHTSVNSWILLRNKKATNRAHSAHLSTWKPAINEAWVAAACFRRAGVCSPRTTAPGLLRFFTSSFGPVVGLGLESLSFLWPLTPWLRISLYFSLHFIPVSWFLNQPISQRTNSFFLPHFLSYLFSRYIVPLSCVLPLVLQNFLVWTWRMLL